MKNLFLKIAIAIVLFYAGFFVCLGLSDYTTTSLESGLTIILACMCALLVVALVHILEQNLEQEDAYEQDYADRHLDSYRDEREW